MKVALLAHSLVSADEPELHQRARTLAGDRKIVRLLEQETYAPFVVALEAIDALPNFERDRAAILTAGEHEQEVGRLPAELFVDDAPTESIVDFYKGSDPAAFLRDMPNACHCMISIARKLRGPSLHFVGGGEAAAYALIMAVESLADGAASNALVVGYSRPGDSSELSSDAVAVVLAAAPSNGGESLVEIDLPAPVELRERRAVDIMRDVIRAHVGTPPAG
ncbi:MAG TPA: hypothetical protein VFA34_15125 [Actinomycetota bacterium]|jgi:hypothetical protein|nr:hypothetical protein [Actinomycetota bacterium]